MDLSTIHILLTILVGATIINGLMMVILGSYIAFELRNIWEALIVSLSFAWDEDDQSDETN